MSCDDEYLLSRLPFDNDPYSLGITVLRRNRVPFNKNSSIGKELVFFGLYSCLLTNTVIFHNLHLIIVKVINRLSHSLCHTLHIENNITVFQHFSTFGFLTLNK